eukprot:9775425-Karenia_brevis.AAC.1
MGSSWQNLVEGQEAQNNQGSWAGLHRGHEEGHWYHQEEDNRSQGKAQRVGQLNRVNKRARALYNTMGADAVSYTHLTLPTICSV